MTYADQMFLSTIFISIEFEDDNKETVTFEGTSFVYEAMKNGNVIPVLITNNHVVPYYPEKLKISMNLHIKKHKEDSSISPTDFETVTFEYPQSAIVRHPDKQVDLCMILLIPAMDYLDKIGRPMLYVPFSSLWIPPKNKLFDSIEEIIIPGFPMGSLYLDQINSFPIARKGITATPLYMDYRGEKKFLIDVDGISGSSGAPVFLYDAIGSKNRDSNGGVSVIISSQPRVYLVGIYCAHFAYCSDTNNPEIKSVNSSNIGIVIKAEQIQALTDELFRHSRKTYRLENFKLSINE